MTCFRLLFLELDSAPPPPPLPSLPSARFAPAQDPRRRPFVFSLLDIATHPIAAVLHVTHTMLPTYPLCSSGSAAVVDRWPVYLFAQKLLSSIPVGDVRRREEKRHAKYISPSIVLSTPTFNVSPATQVYLPAPTHPHLDPRTFFRFSLLQFLLYLLGRQGASSPLFLSHLFIFAWAYPAYAWCVCRCYSSTFFVLCPVGLALSIGLGTCLCRTVSVARFFLSLSLFLRAFAYHFVIVVYKPSKERNGKKRISILFLAFALVRACARVCVNA